MEKYEYLSDTEHVLERKNMYLGDVATCVKNVYICEIVTENGKTCIQFLKQKLRFSPGLLKLLDEAIMNAIDQIQNGATFIKIKINGEKFTVKNNGEGIEIRKWRKAGDMYLPEALFTLPRTSSNFRKETTGAGQNGIGIKLTTIFSQFAKIYIRKDRRTYKQIYRNNTKTKEPPTIENLTADEFDEIETDIDPKAKNKNLVSLSFIPDFDRIDENETNWEEILENTRKIILRRLFELRALIPSSCALFWNNSTISPNYCFELYSRRIWTAHIYEKRGEFNAEEFGDRFAYFEYTGEKSFKIFVGYSPTFEQLTFVNCVEVKDGGPHINKILKQISKNTIVKTRLFIAVAFSLNSPKFTAQNKEKLATGNDLDFLTLSGEDIKRINKQLRLDELTEKTNTKKLTQIFKNTNINKECPKLIDAERAGKKNEFNTLFICEGDSASSLAKIGMTVVGHKNFGCLPLMGKITNVKDINNGYFKKYRELNTAEGNNEKKEIEAKLKKNIISQLLIALGLRIGEKPDLKTMRYQRVIMLKDADSDGANILGLVYNLFDEYFTDLLKIDGFFCEFNTPMIKVYLTRREFDRIEKSAFHGISNIIEHKGEIIIPFYNKPDYEKFLSNNNIAKGVKVEFIKGLAGNQSFEIKEYFKNFNINCAKFDYDKNAKDTLNKAYKKGATFASDRRLWMSEISENSILSRNNAERKISITDFMNNDHLQFMVDSAARAIPSNIDGLKPVQRKIIYGLRKQKDPFKFMKVFQLTGLIANVANYHHGDASLNLAIISMAQNFPGSNNLPLLDSKGFFGSRLMNGADHGQPRYIDVRLSRIVENIFPKIDDSLLKYVTEDNTEVEPVFYVPIIPLILINGSTGLGTGWRSEIPMHSIESAIKSTRNKLNGEPIELRKHINGWFGEIEEKPKTIIYRGKFALDSEKSNVITVTEIPITISINNFLTMLKNSDFIESFRDLNMKNINEIKLEITLDNVYAREDLFKILKLTGQKPASSCRNVFDKDNRIRSYNSYEEMFNEWFNERFNLYELRRGKIINILEAKILKLKNMIRFINAVLSKEIILNEMTTATLTAKLIADRYNKINGSFEYLLSIQMRNATKDNLKRLAEALKDNEKEIEYYRRVSVNEIWANELDKLEDVLRNTDNASP